MVTLWDLNFHSVDVEDLVCLVVMQGSSVINSWCFEGTYPLHLHAEQCHSPQKNFSMTALQGLFGKLLVTCGLWPPRLTDLSLYSYYLSGHWKMTLMKKPTFFARCEREHSKRTWSYLKVRASVFVENICRSLEAFLGSGGGTSKVLSKISCVEWRRKQTASWGMLAFCAIILLFQL